MQTFLAISKLHFTHFTKKICPKEFRYNFIIKNHLKFGQFSDTYFLLEAKRARLMPPVNERIMVYVRQVFK
jgi:hypothetical protein